MKISKTLAAITIILFAALSVTPTLIMRQDERAAQGSGGSERSMFLPNIDVNLDIEDNGDMAVTEGVTYYLSGSWNGLYRDVPLDDKVKVSDVQVSEVTSTGLFAYADGASTELGVNDTSQTFGSTRLSDGTLRIVWHISEVDTTRTYKVHYVVSGQVHRYVDVAELTWLAWGDTSLSGVGQLNITATYPGEAEMDLRVGDYQARATSVKSVSPNMQARVTDLPAENSVEVRLLGDPQAVSLKVEDKLMRKKFEAEQKELDEYYADQIEQNDSLVNFPMWLFPIFVILFALPAGVVIYLIWKTWGSEKIIVEGYVTQAPEEITAPVIGSVLGKDEKHLFTACILDLIRRKKIRTLPAQTGDVVDIALTYPVGQTEFKANYDYEVPALALIEMAIQDGDDVHSVAMGNLKWSDNDAAYEKMQDFKKLLEAHAPQTMIPTLSKGYGWRIVWGLPFALFGALGFASMISVAGDPILLNRLSGSLIGLLMTSNALLMLIAVISGHVFWRYKNQDARRIEWLRFENYFNELAHMEDEQPASIAIWESLLVYAASFGKADLVLKNMRVPKGAEQSSFGYRDGASFHTMNLVAISSLAGASSHVQSQYASDHNSSSSGGGGFSGGGGGGGTGGW